MDHAKVKWGILSTANIGIGKVIPAMQKCNNLEVIGISSRDDQRAQEAAKKLGIPNFYGSYDALLNDPQIEAVYNPLPNHLHFEWTRKAIEKGKHVLCEKPMTLNHEEINELIYLRDKNNVKVGEAFMVHTHPQWLDVAERIQKGEIGKIKAVQGFFSYYKTDPTNIRNIFGFGGGAMWDIGCYPIHTSRFVFNEEPKRVLSLIERDQKLQIDCLGSVILDFPSGHCVFTVGTQLVAHQKMSFFGEDKKIEIEIPFNAPNDRECKISVDNGDLYGTNRVDVYFDVCDQYTMQGEKFSDAIIFDRDVPVSLENALGNTAIIEAIFESEKTGNWIDI